MIEAENIVKFLTEDDFDDETIKDILGPDAFVQPVANPTTEFGGVERHDRWANIDIRNHRYCISYITPVAVYVPGQGVKRTEREWSSATKNHIKKWLTRIGMGREDDWRYWEQVVARVPAIPQEELSAMFKADANSVNWSKRDIKKSRNYRQTLGHKYVEPENQIDLRPTAQNAFPTE